MPGIEAVLKESPDYVAVHEAAKCMAEGCLNGASLIYKRVVKTETGQSLQYSSYCGFFGHKHHEEASWVGWTKLLR